MPTIRLFISQLATYNQNGSIHLTPLQYLFEDDLFFLPSAPASRKTKNILARPEVSIIVDSRLLGFQQWASAVGTVETITGEAASTINRRIFQRYNTQAAFDDAEIGGIITAMIAHDITLCLRPKVWQTWDITALANGLLSQYPERWFLPLE